MTGRHVFWKPEDGIPHVEKLVAADTETELIKDHNFPDVVCLQMWSPEVSHLVWWEDIPEYLNMFDDINPHAHYVFHNAPFDIGVLNHEVIFRALDENRVHDTMVIDTLCCAKNDGFVRKDRKLDQLAKRRLNTVMSKDKDIRCTFTRDMNVSGMSEFHAEYAMKDAEITYKLAEIMQWDTYPTGPLKVKMSVALDRISRNGFLVEDETRRKLRDKFKAEEDEATDILADWGWFPGEKGNDAVMQHILKGVEQDMGIQFDRTPTGKIKTTDESLAKIGGDEFVDAFKKRAHAHKMISTYLGDENIHKDGRVRTRFRFAVTMRTTSSGPNIQNLPRKGGIRNMFIPTPGSLLVSVDYAQLELCALAESCYRRFGFSKLMDTINAGMDCHKYMATFYTGKGIDKITKEERQLAKVANFGYPGGLQPDSFQSYALGYGMKVSLDMAEKAREAWLKAFPEMEQHQICRPDVMNPGKFRTTTWTGFERGNSIGNEIMNTEFQSPSGDGASLMLWNIHKAGYRVVNFIHDEIIVELPLTTVEDIMNKVRDIDRIMVESMQEVIAHVRIKTEAALMTRWFKEAEEEKDSEGNLMVLTGIEKDSGNTIYKPISEILSIYKGGCDNGLHQQTVG